MPQAPQLFPSVCVLTQAPEQLTRPDSHTVRHVPLVQTPPARHALPQPPQLRGSLRMSTQSIPQSVWPG